MTAYNMIFGEKCERPENEFGLNRKCLRDTVRVGSKFYERKKKLKLHAHNCNIAKPVKNNSRIDRWL